MYKYNSPENIQKIKDGLVNNSISIPGIAQFVPTQKTEENWELAIYEDNAKNDYAKHGDVWRINIDESKGVTIKQKEGLSKFFTKLIQIVSYALCIFIVGYIVTTFEELSFEARMAELLGDGSLIGFILFEIACVILFSIKRKVKEGAEKLMGVWLDKLELCDESLEFIVLHDTEEDIFDSYDTADPYYLCDAFSESEKNKLRNQYIPKGILLDIKDFNRMIEIKKCDSLLIMEKYTQFNIIDVQTQSVLFSSYDEDEYLTELSKKHEEIKSTSKTLIYEFDLNETEIEINDDVVELRSPSVKTYYKTSVNHDKEEITEEMIQEITEFLPDIYTREGGISIGADLKHFRKV